MDPVWAAEARRLASRYITEVVERFDFCPWAAPARANQEVWIEVVDPEGLADALRRFLAMPTVVLGLIVLPGLAEPPAGLRRLRDEVMAGPLGREVALADFHPDADLDRTSPSRLVRYLRRSPDPMIQAVRHADLASVHKPPPPMSAADQAAVIAGKYVAPYRDPIAHVAATNLATFDANLEQVIALLDEIHDDRRRTYERLGRLVDRTVSR